MKQIRDPVEQIHAPVEQIQASADQIQAPVQQIKPLHCKSKPLRSKSEQNLVAQQAILQQLGLVPAGSLRCWNNVLSSWKSFPGWNYLAGTIAMQSFSSTLPPAAGTSPSLPGQVPVCRDKP